MAKKATLKKYTVFLYPPNYEVGSPPWWAQVRARGFKSAFNRAVAFCIKDAIKAEFYSKDSAPNRDEFALVAVIEGWNEFKLEV